MPEKILVLGDSHVAVFASDYLAGRFIDYRFQVVAVPGATASGLPNPNAITQAKQQFEDAASATSARTVIVMLV